MNLIFKNYIQEKSLKDTYMMKLEINRRFISTF